MKRIESDGHQKNRFVDQDPTKSVTGTVVSAEWLNAVQEELVALATMNGEALNANSTDQAKQAITTNIDTSIYQAKRAITTNIDTSVDQAKQEILERVTPIENDVIQARGSFNTLTERLAVAGSMLPVFTYKLNSVSGRKMNFDLTLYWKGKTLEKKGFEFEIENSYYKLICYDPDTDEITQSRYLQHRMPLLIIYYDTNINTPTVRKVRYAVTFWTSLYNWQSIVNVNTPTVSDKHLFAWVPAAGKNMNNDLLDSEVFGDATFERCTIDMRGIPLKYRTTPIKLTDCVLQNVVSANSVNIQTGDYGQFAIHGTGNHIHLNDDSTISFDNFDGNTVSLCRSNNYYMIAKEGNPKFNLIIRGKNIPISDPINSFSENIVGEVGQQLWYGVDYGKGSKTLSGIGKYVFIDTQVNLKIKIEGRHANERGDSDYTAWELDKEVTGSFNKDSEPLTTIDKQRKVTFGGGTFDLFWCVVRFREIHEYGYTYLTMDLVVEWNRQERGSQNYNRAQYRLRVKRV